MLEDPFNLRTKNPQNDPSTGQHCWKQFIGFNFLPEAISVTGYLHMTLSWGLSPQKFLRFYVTKSSTSYHLDSLRKEVVEVANVSLTYRGLKAAEQLCEEGVIAGQGQDPLLRHRALHVVVLQDHILL